MRSRERSFASQSVVIFVGIALSMGIGMAFQSYVAFKLGTSSAADAFYLAVTVPTIVATVILGTATNALMRSVVESPGSASFGSRSIGRRLVALAAPVSVAVAVAGVVMLAIDPSSGSSGKLGQIGLFFAITSPVPLLATVAGLGSVAALARRHVIRGTWGGAVNGLGLLAAALMLGADGLSTTDLALSVDVGYLLQMGFISRPLWPKVEIDPPSPDAVRRSVLGFAVLAGASTVYKSQPIVERLTGVGLGAGVPAALGYAEKFTSGLTLLAAFGFTLATLPAISTSLAVGAHGDAVARLRSALTATATTTATTVAFALISASDLVRILYERGAFGRTAATMTTSLVLWSLPTVVFGALAGPMAAAAYADRRIRRVAATGLAGFVVGTAATVAFSILIGYRGIVVGTAVGSGVTFFAFASRLAEVLPGWSWRSFFVETGARIGLVILSVVVTAGVCSIAVHVAPHTTVEELGLTALRFALLLTVGTVALVFLRRPRGRSTAVVEA